MLRKRVCVRVYKKKSLRDSMRGFMQDIPKRYVTSPCDKLIKSNNNLDEI